MLVSVSGALKLIIGLDFKSLILEGDAETGTASLSSSIIIPAGSLVPDRFNDLGKLCEVGTMKKL